MNKILITSLHPSEKHAILNTANRLGYVCAICNDYLTFANEITAEEWITLMDLAREEYYVR